MAIKLDSAWYVGKRGLQFEAFKWWRQRPPTEETHPQFGAVIGPFRTRRGAVWAEKYGLNNPHFQHVNDAERLAKQFEDRLGVKLT